MRKQWRALWLTAREWRLLCALTKAADKAKPLFGGDSTREGASGTGGDGRNDGQSRERKETEEALAARTQDSNEGFNP